jgi:hypothetical protein
MLTEITRTIPYPLDSVWPDLYIPKIVIAGDVKTGKSSLMKRLVGIEDLFSPELLGDLTGCVQIHLSLRTNCNTADTTLSIVNNSTGEKEFTSSNFREVIDELRGMRGRITVFEDKRLVYTVPSRIDLDVIEMSRVAKKSYSVSNSEMEKLIAGNGQNAYFICVSQLENAVRASQIWHLIEVENGQQRQKKVSRTVNGFSYPIYPINQHPFSIVYNI